MLRFGDNKISALHIGTEKIKAAYVGSELVFAEKTLVSRLPAGYTEVEYIQNSNASSYINTKKSFNNSDFTIELSLPNGPTIGRYVFKATGCELQVSSYKTLTWLGDQNAKWYTIYGNPGTEKVIISGSGKTIDANGTVTTMVYANNANNIIFPESASYNSQIIRIYYFKGSKASSSSTSYNFELIPCINPSGVVGLYDLTNEAFIAPTSGTFIAGPAV